jgi:hypothetical protein
VVAADGNFYAVGGLDGVSGDVITETARYNPTQQAWAAVAPAPIPVAGAAAAAANGKVYIAGGDEQGYGITNTLQIYDIATDAWTFGAPLPTSSGSLLAGSAAVAGKVYLLGGMDWSNGRSLDTNYIYDIAANTWSFGAPLPEARHSPGAAEVNGLITLFGGLSNSGVRDDLLVYNPATDTWTTLPGANTGGYGIGGGLVPYGPGQLLALDGATLSSISGLVATNATHIYDIVAATWRPGPRLTDPRFWAGTGVLASGQPIVYGGLSADNPSYYYTLATTEQLPLGPCVTPTPCAVAFNDVPGGSPFYTYVRCLACRGVVSGYPCGGPGEPCPGSYFRPGALVTRGQVSKMVVNALGFLEPIPADQQTFEDVPPGSTFYPYVERLAGREILAGYPCGGPFEPCVGPFYRPSFRPNCNTTRGQLAKIVAEAAGWHEPTAGQTFEDVPSGSTFYSFVERLVSRGIVGGYPCGGVGEPCIDPANRPYYRPNAPATRGQMSKIVANATFPNCSVPDKP